jgi:predicted CopG family antitoxin
MKYMKTITLDDEAYALLKMWKTSGKDSFSMVVKRVVPVPGTLGALLNCVEESETDGLPGNDLMEETINQRSVAKHDPWN